MKNSYLFEKDVIVKEHYRSKQGLTRGNADTFMLIFPADTLDFLITDIFLEEKIIPFFQ